MESPRRRPFSLRNDAGEIRTKMLGALVAIMVVAGVIALVMTITGNNSSGGQAAGAAGQPAGSQVGNTSSAASSSAPAASSGSPSSSTPSSGTPSSGTPSSGTPSSSTPSSSAAATTKPATPASTPATTRPAPRSSASAGTATKVVKYRVRKGDNLTLIAKWFNQRGYGLVYDWNKSVIGQNPNLIYPGQTIIVSLHGDKMNVSAANA